MNNASIWIDPTTRDDAPRKEMLKSIEARNVRIIQAIDAVHKTVGWSSLKDEVFDSLTATLERELSDEAMKVSPDPMKLNRIAGELTWARRFSNLQGFAEEKRRELLKIREQLNYGKSES